MYRKKLIMYVYNDITTDARVLRAANALAINFELTLISTYKGKATIDKYYKNILVGGRRHGALDILDTILAAKRIILKQRPEIVYCHDYYSAILAYLLLKSNFKGKIIYDAHELMIPELGCKDKRLRFFYWFEKRIIKKVDLLICASEERGQIMKEHYGLKELPYVVPNISQLQVNDNDSDVQVILGSLKEFFSDSKPTVVYAGVVTNSRRIEDLLDAVIALAKMCKLLIVGNGSALETLKQKAACHPELNAAFTGAVPYKALGSLLSRCDVGFLYYPVDSLNNKYCASNKIYEYASVGLPMLANENPTVKKILTESKIGNATSNFRLEIETILKTVDAYKINCQKFSKENAWDVEADRFIRRVLRLFD